jgi:hypothetical protein
MGRRAPRPPGDHDLPKSKQTVLMGGRCGNQRKLFNNGLRCPEMNTSQTHDKLAGFAFFGKTKKDALA